MATNVGKSVIRQNQSNLLRNREFRKIFLRWSSIITGFSEVELEGTGMTDTYFETLIRKSIQAESNRKKRSEVIASFYQYFSSIKDEVFSGDLDGAPTEVPKELVSNSFSKKINKMWYTGAWYPEEGNVFNSEVISPEAFQEGLVWGVAKTHPPAAKQPGYGSWSLAPFDE